MVGFPEFFHVNAGHPVLQHPLYLKWNNYTALEIEESLSPGVTWKQVREDLTMVMMTNDNMPIIWYLRNLINIAKAGSLIE